MSAASLCNVSCHSFRSEWPSTRRDRAKAARLSFVMSFFFSFHSIMGENCGRDGGSSRLRRFCVGVTRWGELSWQVNWSENPVRLLRDFVKMHKKRENITMKFFCNRWEITGKMLGRDEIKKWFSSLNAYLFFGGSVNLFCFPHEFWELSFHSNFSIIKHTITFLFERFIYLLFIYFLSQLLWSAVHNNNAKRHFRKEIFFNPLFTASF